MASKGVLMATSIRYSAFYTRNLGNFENVKLGYELETDVPDGEKTNDVRERIKAKVQTWIQEDIEEVDREANGGQ
jgi:hypothetical protein